jgi:hypothetical protein
MLVVCALIAYLPLHSATVNIPSADGPMSIDGVVDESIWKSAAVLPLEPPDFGSPFPEGGEIRVMVRGGYVCVGARVPESGRLVARSTGVNPVS